MHVCARLLPCSYTSVANNLIDFDVSSVGSSLVETNPFFILKTTDKVPGVSPIIREIWLFPRNDSSWNELSNVTVTLTNASTVGSRPAFVCELGVSATAADQGGAVIVECNAEATADYVTIQRWSDTPVKLGLSEVRIMSRGDA